eukprot:4611114-Pyramimonas_sp.AAC.1
MDAGRIDRHLNAPGDVCSCLKLVLKDASVHLRWKIELQKGGIYARGVPRDARILPTKTLTP